MTDRKHDDDGLEGFFSAARAYPPEPSEALMARVHHITIVKNNQCCNLEILAAERSQYIFDG